MLVKIFPSGDLHILIEEQLPMASHQRLLLPVCHLSGNRRYFSKELDERDVTEGITEWALKLHAWQGLTNVR